MFIRKKELSAFMNENRLPAFEDLPKPFENAGDNDFFMVPADRDIREALPFESGGWDKKLEGIKWNSASFIWDEDNKKYTEGEWEVWKDEASKPLQEGLSRFNPVARTLSVNENVIPGLYAAADPHFVMEGQGEEIFQVERMVVFREKEEPIDILLLHTVLFYDYPVKVSYKAILITSVQNAGKADVTYIHFPYYYGREYIREHLRSIVTKETKVMFETDSTPQDSWLVFPYLTDQNVHSDLLPATWKIVSDIWAPAYVSFQLPILQECDGALPKGNLLIVAPRNHVKVGFLTKEDQKLSAEFYYGEHFRYGHDYIDCDYDMEPERYVLTDFAVPAGFEVNEFVRNEKYNGMVDMTSTFLGLGNGGALNKDYHYKMIKIIPPYVYKVNCDEIPEINYAYGFLPKSKNEKKWEPSYKVFDVGTCGYGWQLSELKDVHVIGLFREKDLQFEEHYYILSESGRWYLWNNDLGGMEDDDFRLDGLAEADAESAYCYQEQEEDDEKLSIAGKFIRSVTGYVLGAPNQDGTTIGSPVVRQLRQAAKEQGLRIRTMQGESFLSMMNDMPAIWKVLEGNQRFEKYKV